MLILVQAQLLDLERLSILEINADDDYSFLNNFLSVSKNLNKKE